MTGQPLRAHAHFNQHFIAQERGRWRVHFGDNNVAGRRDAHAIKIQRHARFLQFLDQRSRLGTHVMRAIRSHQNTGQRLTSLAVQHFPDGIAHGRGRIHRPHTLLNPREIRDRGLPHLIGAAFVLRFGVMADLLYLCGQSEGKAS